MTTQMAIGEAPDECATCVRLRKQYERLSKVEQAEGWSWRACAPCINRHEREAIKEFGGG